MGKKYTILSILLVVLALGLVILPKKNDRKETDPRLLLSAIAEKSRYLSADQVTHRIIENDPTLMLIDLRPEDQFKVFALPGAINIQKDSLFSNGTLELLNQPGKDKILLANGDLISEKAWLLLTRYAVSRVYILQGGMNEWFNTIIKEQSASATASSTDLDLINFRNAARLYFTGSGVKAEAPKVTAGETIKVIRKAPAAASGGGC
jgi:rhodanese-related sulfurtransferase